MTIKRIAILGILVTVLGTMAFKSDFSLNSDTTDISPFGELEGYEPVVVLELFTSQGCSSCPPADALLEKVKEEYGNSVFALSYHVDYWNYIGWEDPFGKSEYALKQRRYNLKFKSRSNYTPQLVVNGKEHFVGSSSSKVYAAIQKYQNLKTNNQIVLSDVKGDKKRISFTYEIIGNTEDKSLRAVLVIDQRTTEVKRGENRNRTLKNSNVVVAEKSIAIRDGKGGSFISIPEIVRSDEKIILVLLAENDQNDITGAAKTHVER